MAAAEELVDSVPMSRWMHDNEGKLTLSTRGAPSQNYGGKIKANMQFGSILKGLLNQTTHRGYVYNIISTESFQNSCSLTQMLTLFFNVFFY